jgi:hypothetical protein
MPAPKHNKNAVGNRGGKGRASLYKREYAEQAQKLCAMAGFTDQRLAEWFGVSEKTINSWKLKHVEFASALRAGKAETDDLVERATVAHITGYHVDTEKATRNGKVIVREWVKGDANSGMKWLAARRPEIYREQRKVKHQLTMDEAFLRFLDHMDEQAKLEKARNARLIAHQPQVINVVAVEVPDNEGVRPHSHPHTGAEIDAQRCDALCPQDTGPAYKDEY